MKKIICIIVGAAAALLCLSGCSSVHRVANEVQLHEMLVRKDPESVVRHVEGQALTFAVEKCEIVRRQTNKDEKTDKVDIKLSVYTNDYEGAFYYTLYLDYYDEGGWQLNTYETTLDDELKAKGNTVPKKLIEEEMAKLKEAYGNCELVSESFDSETGTLYHIYNVDSDSKYLKARGDITVEYKLDTRDPSPFFRWCIDEKSGVTQEWKLADMYILDIGGDDVTSSRTDLNVIPSIFVEGNRNDGIREGISTLQIHKITNEEIILSAYVITYTYEDGYVDNKSAGWREFSFDLSASEREAQFCLNSVTGSEINVKLDAERGFLLVRNGQEVLSYKART